MKSFSFIDYANMTVRLPNAGTVIFTMLLAFGVGFAIFWVYRMNYRGVMYSANFGMTLVLMTLISTPVVMCIRSSIELSMGMVGALSIVRFRTAVKDPLDTVYMFWALTMGILLGAGEYFLAILALVLIAGMIFVLRRLQFKTPDTYLLVIRGQAGTESAVSGVIKGIRQQHLKSKTATGEGYEMTLEVRVERQDALINKLLSINGVTDATLVAYQSESL